ncbi:MAG: transglycosylase domain-containing protein, partial [Candidatus Solibacter usitatus]|nr:transglycosylase domain-containing protein [Candidatus Solibacter usitatus]
AEVMITLQLEQRLTKEEIFEHYCNQMNLGRRGSFNVQGFGQGAQAYFGKDIRELNAAEAALLAGILQNPSYYNPFRFEARAKERRNVVLSLMRQNGYLTDRQYAVAADSPLNLAPGGLESTDAPYFVDLVNDELQSRFQDHDFQAAAYRIYTTLDMNLQRAASEAVRIGMRNVDEQLKKQRRFRNVAFPEAQVALVALDPHTGEVKALIGGRNYGLSQLNRVLAKRQPGSVFKPWVYAVAMNTAVSEGATKVLTPLTKILDEPTTFWYDEKPYEPGNFGKEYHGEVTLRYALAHSINIPTVKVAEMVGYDNVVNLARDAGMNINIQPTPSVALGAYEVTPVEVSGAYTVFSNGGAWVQPNWITLIRAQDGSTLYRSKPETRQVLDPRVAYMMVNLLEEVTRTGTAAGIRSRGFVVPAAGKTGTSHDGWFAGFTSELLCVVWVGFDDNTELHLEGAKSALPIWVEFMKRALEFKEYHNTKPFEAPDGIVTVPIDPLSGQPATAACPNTKVEVFVAGTQPLDSCRLHGGGQPGVTHVTGWDQPAPDAAGRPGARPGEPPPPTRRASLKSRPADTPAPPAAASKEEEKKEKKGFFRRLLGMFK